MKKLTKNILAVLLSSLLLYGTAWARVGADSDWVSEEEAIEIISRHRQTLGVLWDGFKQKYTLGMQNSLAQEMNKHGVEISPGRLEVWSGQQADHGKKVSMDFYWRHDSYLKKSIQNAKRNGGVPRSDLIYLQQGMRSAATMHRVLMDEMQRKLGYAALRQEIINLKGRAKGNPAALQFLKEKDKQRIAAQDSHQDYLWGLADFTAFSPLSEVDRVAVVVTEESANVSQPVEIEDPENTEPTTPETDSDEPSPPDPESRLQELERQLAEAETGTRSESSRIRELRKEREELEKKRESLEAEDLKYKNDIAELESQAKKVRRKDGESTEAFTKRWNKAQEAKRNLPKLKKEYEEWKKGFESKSMAIERDLLANREQMDIARANVAKPGEGRLNETRASHVIDSEKLRTAIEELKRKHPFLTKEEKPGKLPLPRKSEKFERATRVKEQLIAKGEEFRKHLRTYRDKWTDTDEINAWKQERHRLAEQLTTLQRDYAIANTDPKYWQADENAARKEIASIQDRLRVKDREIDEAEAVRRDFALINRAWKRSPRPSSVKSVSGQLSTSTGKAFAELIYGTGSGNAEQKLQEARDEVVRVREERRQLELAKRAQYDKLDRRVTRGTYVINELMRVGDQKQNFRVHDVKELTQQKLSPLEVDLLGPRGTAIYKDQEGNRNGRTVRK